MFFYLIIFPQTNFHCLSSAAKVSWALPENWRKDIASAERLLANIVCHLIINVQQKRANTV